MDVILIAGQCFWRIAGLIFLYYRLRLKEKRKGYLS
jgi:hypothetical protein